MACDIQTRVKLPNFTVFIVIILYTAYECSVFYIKSVSIYKQLLL